MVILLHKPRSSSVSLISARSIHGIVCISSIHLFLRRPLFLLPSPRASIISFSRPFARISCPKKSSSVLLPSFCLRDIYPLVCPVSISIDSFVVFSVRETLGILLQIHIPQASIFFSNLP